MILKRAVEDNHIDYIPNSVDVTYEMAFNRLDEKQDVLATKAVFESKIQSNTLLVCIDRGITDDMNKVVSTALENNKNVKIVAYTLLPKGTVVRKIIDAINEDEMSEKERYNTIINICRKLITKNRMIYTSSGDLTNYRVNFKRETIDTEKSALISLSALLENKIKRDFVNSRDQMAENPFEILNTIRQKAQNDIKKAI